VDAPRQQHRMRQDSALPSQEILHVITLTVQWHHAWQRSMFHTDMPRKISGLLRTNYWPRQMLYAVSNNRFRESCLTVSDHAVRQLRGKNPCPLCSPSRLCKSHFLRISAVEVGRRKVWHHPSWGVLYRMRRLAIAVRPRHYRSKQDTKRNDHAPDSSILHHFSDIRHLWGVGTLAGVGHRRGNASDLKLLADDHRLGLDDLWGFISWCLISRPPAALFRVLCCAHTNCSIQKC